MRNKGRYGKYSRQHLSEKLMSALIELEVAYHTGLSISCTGSKAHFSSLGTRLWHLDTRTCTPAHAHTHMHTRTCTPAHAHPHMHTCARTGADGVIVGSAIIEIVGRNLSNPDMIERKLQDYVMGMIRATGSSDQIVKK